MNLTNPGALIWAGLAVPIVIFYILKIRMKRVPVSTVMFWEQVFEEKKPRSFWQTLRHLLSLLVQLIFLGLLVFAVTEPFFNSEIRDQRRLVIVVDNSASMRATDANPTRLDAARASAHKLITSLKPHDEMAIMTAGNQPTVVCGLTSHHRTLQKALDKIEFTDSPTRVTSAVSVARRLLAGHKRGQVIVLTDGCFPEAKTLASAKDIVWESYGGETPNVGITQFQVRRSLLDPVGYEILIEVSNFSDENVECRLDLELAGEIVDVIPLKLDANGNWSDVLEKTSSAGGQFIASLDHEDEFSIDNDARAILPERRRLPVTLVTAGNLFLERVLEANDLVDLTVTQKTPKAAPPNGVLVLHKPAVKKIPAGNVFVVQPVQPSDLWNTQESIDNPLVTKQDEDSDLLTHVKLENVLMPEALRLEAKDIEPHVLVESASEDPIYLSYRRKADNVLVLTVNLDRGDLPLRTAFPIMVTNALAWFTEGKGELSEAVPTGEIADINLPASLQKEDAASKSRNLVLADPNGNERLIPGGTETTIGPLPLSGVWRIHEPQEDNEDWANNQMEVACNLTNAVESDLRMSEEIEPQQRVVQAGFGGRPIWFYLVLLAWILVGTEWFLYQRRYIS